MEHMTIRNRIQDVLRQEQNERVIDGNPCTYLQCIGTLIQANVSLIQDYLHKILNNYSQRFKSSLALMHDHTPEQKAQDKDEDFKKRLDVYFENVVNALAKRDSLNYVSIYLYATATVLQIPVYVLKEDENSRLSWFFFPPLFDDVKDDEHLKPIVGLTYLTMFVYNGMRNCLPITSTDRAAGPPSASGYIGMLNDALNTESIDSIAVPDGMMRQHESLHKIKQGLVNIIDSDIMRTCSETMLEKRIVEREKAEGWCAHRLTNQNKLHFIDELINSRDAFRIFIKCVIRYRRWDIWGLIFEDFDNDMDIRHDSPELNASYITLPLSADEIKQAIDIEQLRTWLNILKEEKCPINLETEDIANITREFVNCIMKSKQVYRHFCKILLVRREDALLECLGYSEQFRSAGTCLHLCKYVVLKDLENALLKRAHCVNDLKQACLSNSSEIEERRGRVNWAVIGGASTGVVGGALAIAGIALSPFTAGLSLGLTIAGAAVGASSGAVSGGARGFEAYKQIKSIKDIKEMQQSISEMELNVQERFKVACDLFARGGVGTEGGTGANTSADLRGFLAIGSALRSAHGFVALGIAAARVGTTAAAVAASVFGPLSIIVDIGFLVEAGVNKNQGDKVSTAEQLRQTATVVEMKSRIMNSVWRGDYDTNTNIVYRE